ncbi:MAG: polysaccharide biosynthesis tyrosine autokinase [Microbacterium sp.]
MDTQTFWRTVRVHWILIVGLTILGAVLGPILVPLPPTTYTATTTVVASTAGAPDDYALNQVNQFIRARNETWAALGTQSVVLQPVYMGLGPDLDYSEFQASVTVTPLPSSGVIQIQVVGDDKAYVTAAAEGVADTLAQVVMDVDLSDNPQRSNFTMARVGETVTVRGEGESLAPLYATAGAVVGLAIALIIAVVRARNTARIRVRADLDRLGIGLPVAAQLPRGYTAPPAPLVDGASAPGALSDASRQVRTAVLAAAPSGGTVVVTAATRGEGASLTASRLAVALAESSYKVALVDADLRRPTLFQSFDLTPNPGLGQAIAGDPPVADVVQTTALAALDVVVAGEAPNDPSDLLGTAEADAYLAALAKEYDYVIIDAPALSRHTDAAELGRDADLVLLVVSAAKARREPVTKALSALQSARIENVEIVLNRGRFNIGQGILTAGA